jgi:hypothetical protein
MSPFAPLPLSIDCRFRRRELLRAGSAGMLGLSLSKLLSHERAHADNGTSRTTTPKSVIIVFLTGAASHHDTFDLKPEAPAEIRGEFRPIATSIPGYSICEHLPRLAARADKYAVVRTLSHGDNNHLMSTHHVLTGKFQPGAFFDKVASRDDWPCYSAGVACLQPNRNGVPCGVNLPTFLQQGPLTWPGQHAGLLGPKFDPWQITGDPNDPNFRVDNLTLSPGIDVGRLNQRQTLLEQVHQQQQQLGETAESRRLSDDQQLAFSLLTSNRLTQAFELNREPDAVRDRYGRHTTGQSLLLARRLIQSGVRVVQTNIGAAQTWDNHGNIFPTLKDRLLPPLDQGVAALLDDLHDLGLINDTLVLMMGEFGRTPKINGGQGRDHWGPCFFALFAGAGVRGGQVIGKSDAIGAYPVTTAFSPDDLGATVYRVLGISPDAEVRDRLNRPLRLNSGEVIEPLFTGAAA